MENLTCVKCGKAKDASEFYLRKRKLANGLVASYPRRDCKKCSGKRYSNWISKEGNRKSNKETQREWAKNNPDRCENARLKYRFGITLAQYKELLQAQNYSCAICKITTEEYAKISKHKFHVDHCHDTGEVRGLLCNNCNVSLGGFKDKKEILESAIAYLTRQKLHDSIRFNTAGATVKGIECLAG
jgi:hypothetical protein